MTTKLVLAALMTLSAACSSAPEDAAPTTADTAVEADADQLVDDTGTGLDFDATPHDPDTGPIGFVESGPPEDTYVPPVDTGSPIVDTGVADTFTGIVVTYPAPGDLLTGKYISWTGTTLGIAPIAPDGAGVESTRTLPTGRTFTKCRYRIEVTGTPATGTASEPNLRVTFISNADVTVPVIKYITAPQTLTGDCALPLRPYKDDVRVIIKAVCPASFCTEMKVLSGSITLEP